jgi:hypothetical protein
VPEQPHHRREGAQRLLAHEFRSVVAGAADELEAEALPGAHQDLAVAMRRDQDVQLVLAPAEEWHQEMLAVPQRDDHRLFLEGFEERRIGDAPDAVGPADQPVVAEQQISADRQRDFGEREPLKHHADARACGS